MPQPGLSGGMVIADSKNFSMFPAFSTYSFRHGRDACASGDGQIRCIWDFTLHPNPTTGKFVADIVLPETGTIGIKIFSFANNALMVRQKASGASSYSVPLDLSGLPAGIYAVVLETPFGNALRKVILN